MSLFQSNLRKQIRNLPKILNFVKKIHYYSKLFTSLLGGPAGAHPGEPEDRLPEERDAGGPRGPDRRHLGPILCLF